MLWLYMAIHNRNMLGYWLLPPGEGTAAYDTVLKMVPLPLRSKLAIQLSDEQNRLYVLRNEAKHCKTCMQKAYAKATPNKCCTAHCVKSFFASPSPANCVDFERLFLLPFFAWLYTIGPGLAPNLFKQFGDWAEYQNMLLVIIDSLMIIDQNAGGPKVNCGWWWNLETLQKENSVW